MDDVPGEESDENEAADDYADHTARIIALVRARVVVVTLSKSWSTEGRESRCHYGEGEVIDVRWVG